MSGTYFRINLDGKAARRVSYIDVVNQICCTAMQCNAKHCILITKDNRRDARVVEWGRLEMKQLRMCNIYICDNYLRVSRYVSQMRQFDKDYKYRICI